MKACLIGSPLGIPQEKELKLTKAIQKAIHKGCSHFICGDYSNFDNQAKNTLVKVKKEYPYISMIKIRRCLSESEKDTSLPFKTFLQKLSMIKSNESSEKIEEELERLKKDYPQYAEKFSDELKNFDHVVFFNLEKVPDVNRCTSYYKKIVENSDVVILYYPRRLSMINEIKAYALKENKFIIDV